MQRNNMKNNHLAILIISIVLLVGAGIAALFLYGKTNAMQEELATLHSQVQVLSLQSKTVLALRESTSVSSGQTENINTYFIGKDKALDFVKYIESLAVSSGVTYTIDVVDTSPDNSLSPANKEFLRIAIRFSGNMKNVRRFISLIETLPYNVKINRFDLRRTSIPATANGAVDSWNAVLDFSTVKTIDK